MEFGHVDDGPGVEFRPLEERDDEFGQVRENVASSRLLLLRPDRDGGRAAAFARRTPDGLDLEFGRSLLHDLHYTTPAEAECGIIESSIAHWSESMKKLILISILWILLEKKELLIVLQP